jgi:ATP-dependent protease HslVU (ClpYQ) peptidase subunit
MTLVIGLKDKDRVWMGADSFSSTSFHGKAVYGKKIFKPKDNNNVLIGICGSHRHQDLLQFTDGIFNKVDMYENKVIDREYLVTKVVPNISKVFRDNKCEYVENGESYGGSFIFGFKDGLYELQSDYSILESMNDYLCIGSGMYHADGAMEATKGLNLEPVERLKLALQATEHHQLNVRRPFIIMNTLDDEVITIE